MQTILAKLKLIFIENFLYTFQFHFLVIWFASNFSESKYLISVRLLAAQKGRKFQGKFKSQISR